MRRALVVGRARGALEEYAAARALCVYDDVLVVGAMAAEFPDRVDHVVSFHAELFNMWAEQRSRAGLAPAGCYWGARYKGRNLGEDTVRVRPLRYADCNLGGSSGFLAARGVALLALGADRVVLAGVPMQADAAHVGSYAPWDEADRYWPAWLEYKADMLGRVRSMSGRTRDLLGEPTREWLSGTAHQD